MWLEDLPFKVELKEQEVYTFSEQELSMKSAERKHILKVLTYTGWNKTKTANLLKISRPTLDKKISEYHITIKPT